MNIPRMSYPQYRKARRLTHECCNYCNGNCLLLDDGEECVCVQSISYSLLCRWFKVAVLPLDAALCAEITKGRDEIKRCAVCGAAFTPNSNRAKYCPDCAVHHLPCLLTISQRELAQYVTFAEEPSGDTSKPSKNLPDLRFEACSREIRLWV